MRLMVDEITELISIFF